MLDIIFEKIETRIKNHPDFINFEFFRFLNSKNSNQQSKGSIPYVSLTWSQERSQKSKQWALTNNLSFFVLIRWKTSYSNVNALERIQEQKKYVKALKEVILQQQGDENYLGIENINDVSIRSIPAEISGIEIKKHNGIDIDLSITYTETF